MAYLELFETAANHVRGQGANVRLSRGKPLSASLIQTAQLQAPIPIPSSMADFYEEVGDGFSFSWSAEGSRMPFADVEFPKLSEITRSLLGNLYAARIEWMRDYDFRYTVDPVLAKQTAVRMQKWLPFHEEGNGDEFCLDLSRDPAPVVFNQHDWFDGGTGENGHLLGTSLLEFYTEWMQVCFQYPSELYWPSVFDKFGGGVRWDSEQFRTPFLIQART